MVTSNKLPEKFVTMAAQNPSAVVPQRTLLGEVNEHITCPLCRGYYIDATTIVECLHSFCRSCIIKHLQVKSYCPVCEMMINSAKPNIKLDKALQDIVYKLVPGLFQKEMERRQQFYASRPGPAASATPEQRGEDTERIIFSPEDVISFSLEYADITDSDSISSKSSDSNEPQPTTGGTRRYLQCPAVVNISHLKKFLSMKFDIDSTQFAINILYKRVPLPDYYTLMDIAYIYNWKRNEPMRFFYQIIDYIAIRNRILDINRKGSHFRDRKSSPTSTEDTNVSSPAPNLNDQASEGSSGADSPMPDDVSVKQANETKKCDRSLQQNKSEEIQNGANPNKNVILHKKSDDEVEKSQFLNSFELTAKSNSSVMKVSPTKTSSIENNTAMNQSILKTPIFSPKIEDSLKRKQHTPPNSPEIKKLKIELEKTKMPTLLGTSSNTASTAQTNAKTPDNAIKPKDTEPVVKTATPPTNNSATANVLPPKEVKPQPIVTTNVKQVLESPSIKRTVPVAQNNLSSPKRKPTNEIQSPLQPHPPVQKTVSPLKLQIPKLETQMQNSKTTDMPKPNMKKMPDLKPSTHVSQPLQNKGQHVNKVRMDLLANNSDPTIDRSKILSQVKSSLSCQNTLPSSGDPLKSIFDSCNINIPSSLSITLTDQKLDCRNTSNDVANTDQKKNIINKNLSGVSNVSGHKVPSPPVHNYIEILKLPDSDPKKANKAENNSDTKTNASNKSDATNSQTKIPNKSSETSAKGPVPNLKPIADTKIGKQSGNFSAPITFQQTFEQQLQSLQTEKKPKLPKTKTQVPKLVPAPKAFNVGGKSPNINKPNTSSLPIESKPSSALDLSTPHNIQSQVAPQQTFDKALETMQSIANLAKKQNLPSKGLPLTSMAQTSAFSGMPNRPLTSGVSSMRVPSTNNINQMKHDKTNPHNNSLRQEVKSNPIKSTNNQSSSITPPNYQLGSNSHGSANTAQPSPRSQTRSPSSSPKLVIAEDKQATSSLEQGSSQVMSMMNTQMPTMHSSKNESLKPLPGPSKSGLKPVKPLQPAGKVPGIRTALTLNPTTMNTPTDYMTRPQVMSAHHALLRHQMDAWIKVQRQFDLMKSMSNLAHQSQNDYNKEK